MEKKVGDIVEAFQNYRFQDSLRQIEQLIKKTSKDNKKKNTLSQNDERIIQIIKCGCLASTARLHEANQIIQNYFTQKVIQQLPVQQIFLFCSIAQLSYDNKLLQKVNLLIEKKGGKGDVRLQRFMLTRKMFSFVSKTFLKQYIMGKRAEDGLAQIFLEYLNEFCKNNSIEKQYQQDFTIRQHSELNLKMVEMFFAKYLSGIKMEELKNQKLKSSIIDLRIRLAINGKRIQEAKKIYSQNYSSIRSELKFVYLRSIRDFSEEKDKNIAFYCEECGRIFRQNLSIEKYVPMYDYYDQFLNFILNSQSLHDFSKVKQSLSGQISTDLTILYQLKNDKQTLNCYFRSLYQQFNELTQGEQKEKQKKSDYYKISVKGLLLQMLKIYCQVFHGDEDTLTNNKTFSYLLEQYKQFFGKTLTYINEMQRYIKFLYVKLSLQKGVDNVDFEVLPQQFEKSDDKLIFLINKVKITAIMMKSQLNQKESLQVVKKWAHLLWSQYKKFIVTVEQDKRRQKGQVFLCDQFITLLADIVIYFIENNKDSETLNREVLSELMVILDYTTEKSPYNGYLKLRLIYVAQKLNYFDKLIDTYLSMDIKSVQFQTLSYYFLSPLINFNIFSQYEGVLVRMVRSYQDNQRQTSEYCLKGLKAGTTNQVLEYFSYQRKLQKSLSKMMLFYSLFLKYNNQTSGQNKFYLEWIEKKLKDYEIKQEKISFNCDTKTMLNTLLIGQKAPTYLQNRFNQFFGILSNVHIFKLEINVRKLQTLARSIVIGQNKQNLLNFVDILIVVQEEIKNIKKLTPKEMFNFDEQYEFIDQYLGKVQYSKKDNFQAPSMTQKLLMKELQFYLIILQFKLEAFKLFKQFIDYFTQTEKTEDIQKQIEELKTKSFEIIQEIFIYFENKLNWNEQVKLVWLMRENCFTISHLFSSLSEQFNKHKKIPKTYKTTLQNFTNVVEEIILTKCSDLKFKQCPLVFKSRLLGQFQGLQPTYYKKNQERNQILSRYVTMDKKQVKKLLLRK